jgi:hypothetical protein
MNFDKLPIYDLNYPYDSLKLIAATILGEPRLVYKVDEIDSINPLINAVWIDPETKSESVLFKVNNDALHYLAKDDVIFGDAVNEDIKSYNSLSQYGQLLYQFGKVSLNFIAATLISIDNKGKREPLSDDFEILYYKLNNAIQAGWEDIRRQVGDSDGENGEITKVRLNLRNLYDLTMRLHKTMEASPEYWLDIGDILTVTYGALSSLLCGLTIKFTGNSMVNPNQLFNTDSDISKNAVNTFSNTFVHAQGIDMATKNRYIALLIVYHKMNEFYRINTSITIDDPLFNILAILGEEFYSLPEDRLIENIDLTALNQGDIQIKTTITLESFLHYENFFKNPKFYNENSLKYDTNDKSIVAKSIFELFDINPMNLGGLKTKYTPAYTSIIEEEFPSISEGDVPGFYIFFLNLADNIQKNKIDPNFYHLLSLSALTFRKLTKGGSKSDKEFAYLGLYQAEALMTFLWHDWFCNDKFFNISNNVHCADTRAVGLKLKAQAYIRTCIISYIQSVFEITKPSFYNTENDLFLYTRDFYNTNSLYLTTKELNKADYDTNHISFILDSNINGTIIETTKNLKINTGLSSVFDFIPRDNSLLVDEEADDDYEYYYNDEIPLIALYAKYGNEIYTYGLLWVKKVLDSEFESETYDCLEELSSDNVLIPMIVTNILSNKISQNIIKISKGKFGTSDRFNKYFTILLKGVLPIGFAREAMYNTIDQPEYIEKEHDPDRNNTILSYGNILPFVEKKSSFSFLDRK